MSKSKFDSNAANQTPLDAARRRTLKVIGAGLATPFAALSGASWLQAADNEYPLTKPQGENAGMQIGAHAHDIELHLYSSQSVIEDSLLIRNRLERPLVVKKVNPSVVVYQDRYVDLRSLIGDTPLTLAPGHTVSFRVYSQPLYGRSWSQLQTAHLAEADLPDGTSYLWAQDSINVITDDTILVSVAAVVVDDTAIVYNKPRQPMARNVQFS